MGGDGSTIFHTGQHGDLYKAGPPDLGGTQVMIHSIAHDPETHELAVWSHATGRPCPTGTYGKVRRLL